MCKMLVSHLLITRDALNLITRCQFRNEIFLSVHYLPVFPILPFLFTNINCLCLCCGFYIYYIDLFLRCPLFTSFPHLTLFVYKYKLIVCVLWFLYLLYRPVSYYSFMTDEWWKCSVLKVTQSLEGSKLVYNSVFLGGRIPPPLQWARASSFMWFRDHTQRRTTVGRTPLDGWSARRRDLYLPGNTRHSQQTDIHAPHPWWDSNTQSK